jgi:nitrilase
MNRSGIDSDIPHVDLILKNCPEILANGGSCIAGPDGEWIIEPVIDKEELLVAKLDHGFIFRERQNFDPSGHYSRPDVTKLIVDRKRQIIAEYHDS